MYSKSCLLARQTTTAAANQAGEWRSPGWVGWGCILVKLQLPKHNAAGCCRKVPELIKPREAHSRGLGVIKRFTGGGTVVVDCDTIFTTLIMNVRWGGLALALMVN